VYLSNKSCITFHFLCKHKLMGFSLILLTAHKHDIIVLNLRRNKSTSFRIRTTHRIHPWSNYHWKWWVLDPLIKLVLPPSIGQENGRFPLGVPRVAQRSFELNILIIWIIGEMMNYGWSYVYIWSSLGTSDMCMFECYIVCVCTKLGCKRFMLTSIVSINIALI
jgi:hypothetical protein